ncbi:hypothetical protein WJU16_21885 [Chitinophaga pollutisoli]|uniref:Tn3 transposase DDE domain-containing protein n=1 Tax=Chitinophaga pollutisoli TaxID=3133966 RepID=A0ABZ2YNW5_9BACT
MGRVFGGKECIAGLQDSHRIRHADAEAAFQHVKCLVFVLMNMQRGLCAAGKGEFDERHGVLRVLRRNEGPEIPSLVTPETVGL